VLVSGDSCCLCGWRPSLSLFRLLPGGVFQDHNADSHRGERSCFMRQPGGRGEGTKAGGGGEVIVEKCRCRPDACFEGADLIASNSRPKIDG